MAYTSLPRDFPSLEMPKSLFRFGESPIWSTYLLGAGCGADAGVGPYAKPAFGSGSPGELSHACYRLFVVPLGQVGQGFAEACSIAETNLKEGGRVPSGVAFDIARVSWETSGESSSDCALVLEYGTWAWDFTQTLLDGGVLNEGRGPGAVGGAMAYARHPVSVPGNTTFAILVRFGRLPRPLKRPVRLRFTLHGAYKNVVELG